MGAKLGLSAKLFYKANGMDEAGAWAELDIVKDVTLSLEKGEADATTRAAQGWKQILAGLKDATIEFDIVWDPDDEGFDAVHDAFFNNRTIGVSVMDGPLATGSGLQCDAQVLGFTRNEPLEEVITASVRIKPAYSASPPRWLQAGASPTGTDTY